MILEDPEAWPGLAAVLENRPAILGLLEKRQVGSDRIIRRLDLRIEQGQTESVTRRQGNERMFKPRKVGRPSTDRHTLGSFRAQRNPAGLRKQEWR